MSFRNFGVVALVMVIASSGWSHTAEAQASDLSHRIDSVVQVALNEGRIAGLSVAVVQGERVLHAEGYGWADVENRSPARDGTVYVIASVTKLLTAAAVMSLVDAGRLRLEETLASLLPEFPNKEQARRIVLRQLLNHTSGLNDILPAAVEYRAAARRPIDLDFVLDYVEGRELDFDPGSNWSYSNTGFLLAGAIVERLTGQSYGSYVRDILAGSAGLRDTFLCDANLHSVRRAVGYTPSDSGFIRNADYELPGDTTGYGAAGGFCSTALNLAQLPGALKRHGVLSEAALSELLKHTPLSTGSSVDYGLGVRRGRLEGQLVWGHTGGSGSTWAIVAHYPARDVTIAVLMNTAPSRVDAWVLEGRVARAVLDLPPARIVERPITAEASGAYVGSYADNRYRRQYAVTHADGHLQVTLNVANARPTELVFAGAHTFSFRTAPMDRVVFHVEDGVAHGYSVYLDGIFSGFRKRTDR